MSSTQKLAVIIFSLLGVVVGFLSQTGQLRSDLALVVIVYLIDLTLICLSLIFLKHLRETSFENTAKRKVNLGEYSLFGYLWRVTTILIASKFIGYFIAAGIWKSLIFPSTSGSIVVAGIQLVIIPTLAWLCYSEARMQHLKHFFRWMSFK